MGQLTRTAADMWASSASELTVQNGQIVAPGGKAATIRRAGQARGGLDDGRGHPPS